MQITSPRHFSSSSIEEKKNLCRGKRAKGQKTKQPTDRLNDADYTTTTTTATTATTTTTTTTTTLLPIEEERRRRRRKGLLKSIAASVNENFSRSNIMLLKEFEMKDSANVTVAYLRLTNVFTLQTAAFQ
ncbi:hypothetical protein T4B_15104 [Trichinella pseudospiralis]|uniref:Uncharacterized protein n=1 Tax=Trichinella pseudospiralis TaxID=6337 RepID=A0A0V1IGJ3_TRIPS|nr:hypothetical protein T4B_15104 [Trichinella pseudospiralis]KRZ42306.1 hypothetical protein T4C_12412 [Trichinella pseudospiralis]